MKKFYALAAAAIMAVAANAQNGAPLYYTGDGLVPALPEFATWAPEAPAQFTYADGVYTLQTTDMYQFKMSTAMGTWEEFNGGALGCGEAGYGDTPGVAAPLEPWGENIIAPWKGDYTITVAGDLSTVTLTTTTPTPEDAGQLVLFFRGDMNGWGSGDDWKWTKVTDNVYKFVCGEGIGITPDEGWKVATDPWDDRFNYGAPDAVILDIENEMECGGGSPNSMLEEAWNGVAYIKIGAAGESASIFLSNDKDAECPFDLGGVKGVTIENNAVAVYYTLQGIRVANPENGLFIVVKGGKASKVLVK